MSADKGHIQPADKHIHDIQVHRTTLNQVLLNIWDKDFTCIGGVLTPDEARELAKILIEVAEGQGE